MDEAEILEMILAWLPETLEGWLAIGCGACAILAIAIPEPPESAHPAIKICHRLVCIFGLGAGKLRAAGPRKGDAACHRQASHSVRQQSCQRLRSRLGKAAKIASLFRGKK